MMQVTKEKSSLVNVLMCVYNAEHYVNISIESILSQSYSDFEFIVIDDGSTDRTGEILDSYRDSRLKIIHQVNQGVSKSRNRLLKLSKGEYIAVQDGDDISLKDRLKTQVKFLSTHPDVAVVGSFIEIIDEEGLPVNGEVIRVVKPEQIKKTLDRGVNCIMHGSVMFRRSILDVVKGYDERFSYAHDYELWLRVSEHFKLANIAQVLYKLRSHSNKISSVHSLDQHVEMRLAHKLAKGRKKVLQEKRSLEKKGAYRRFSSDSLRILVFRQYCSCGHPQIIQDCICALKDLGHIIKVSDYTKNSKEDILINEIKEFHPDFLFTLNHTYLTSEVLSTLTVMRIPHASWFVEDPFLWLPVRCISPYSILFICDRIWLQRLKEVGFENVFYLPVGTNPKFFKRLKLSKEDRRRFACNISFVGGANYGDYKKFYEDALKTAEDSQHKVLLREVVNAQASNPILDISQILETIEQALGYDLSFENSEQRRYIERGLEYAAMAVYRSNLLKKIADLGLDLHGDKDGWKRLININSKVRFFGDLDYCIDLPKLYNASKISLNITAAKLKTGVSLRVFDASACGAFILTDYRSDLGRLFKLGEEVVCYRNEQELRDLCGYYLKHPTEREEIAKRTRNRILKEHTYRHRVQQMVNIMRKINEKKTIST